MTEGSSRGAEIEVNTMRNLHFILGLGLAGLSASALVACGGGEETSSTGNPTTSGAGGAGGMSGSTGANTGGSTATGTGGSASTGTGGSACANVDCDDGISCTIDTCTDGVCSHQIGPNSGPTACPAGQICDLLKGCLPGIVCSTDDQCVQKLGNDACKTNITCDPGTALCSYTLLDKDMDGHVPVVCGGDDCNDASNTSFPGAPEICDGKDNNCDGAIDTGATCPGQGTCQNGACVCPPENNCGGQCVDKQTDKNHCGACFNACPSAANCVAGQCMCASNSTVCNGQCVDTTSDPQNCGGCNNGCALGYSCQSSSCVCLKTPCNGACIDTNSDPQNCGGCNIQCPSGAMCQAGMCQCPSGLTLCAGQCVDTMSNPNHCGMCNKQCGACQNGVCQTCPVADLHLMLDTSGSMTGTRWTAATSGISAFMNLGTSSGIGLGLGFFPVTQPNPDECTLSNYTTPAVPIALLPGVAASINNTLNITTPNGLTPTSAALQGALTYAKSYETMNPSHKGALVFITDGDPTVCDTNIANIANIAASFANGAPPIKTYVIGIDNSVSLANLNQIAFAGGTGSAISTVSALDIQNALNSIRASFATCP